MSCRLVHIEIPRAQLKQSKAKQSKAKQNKTITTKPTLNPKVLELIA